MESNNSLCRIKVPHNWNSTTPVFVVAFSNGCLNSKYSNSINFTCYRHEEDDDHLKARRILIANNGHLNYKGLFGNNYHPLKSSHRYCIGVRNKTTGKMKLYQCILIHLKPEMRALAVNPVPSGKTPDKNYMENKDFLAINFGSKGKKRAVNARLQHSVDSAHLTDTLKNIELHETSTAKENGGSTTSTMDYIPKRNPEALSPSEVYSIQDIISDEEEKHLFHLANAFIEEYPIYMKEWEENGSHSKYVLAHLEDNVDIEKAKKLIYYDYLVMFSKLTYKEIVKKDPLPEIDPVFKNKLLDNFSVSSNETGKVNRKLPQRIKDKLVSHLFVLALIIDDYCVNIPLIQNDLKYSHARLVEIAKAVGCHVVSHKINDQSVQYAELRLPLFVYQRFSKK